MIRGDVFALGAPRRARGREQRGQRYGVIVQATESLGLSTVIVAPTSTQALQSSFRPRVRVGDRVTRVLVEQVSAVDLSRLGDQHGRVTFEEMQAIDEALRLILDLT